MDDSTILDALRHAVPDAAIDPAPSVDMPTIYVDREHIIDVCRQLRDDPSLQFSLLADVTAVDRLPAEPRFEVVYHLASLGESFALPGAPVAPARRLRIKVPVPGADPRVPTVTSVYPTAGWPEREVYDLMGLSFDGHPDLRRILMTDEWEGHPLRKDYPVQIRQDTPSWSPLQISAEEFAENVRRSRERATAQATSPHGPEGRDGG